MYLDRRSRRSSTVRCSCTDRDMTDTDNGGRFAPRTGGRGGLTSACSMSPTRILRIVDVPGCPPLPAPCPVVFKKDSDGDACDAGDDNTDDDGDTDRSSSTTEPRSVRGLYSQKSSLKSSAVFFFRPTAWLLSLKGWCTVPPPMADDVDVGACASCNTSLRPRGGLFRPTERFVLGDKEDGEAAEFPSFPAALLLLEGW